MADEIAIGPSGEVYVSVNNMPVPDFYLRYSPMVMKYSPDGLKLTEWFVGDVDDGIATVPRGEVYVIINNSSKVVKYSPEGGILNEWTVDGVMSDIAVGPNGLVYVSFTHDLIQVFEE